MWIVDSTDSNNDVELFPPYAVAFGSGWSPMPDHTFYYAPSDPVYVQTQFRSTTAWLEQAGDTLSFRH